MSKNKTVGSDKTKIIFIGPSPKDMGGFIKNDYQNNLVNLIYNKIKESKGNVAVITDLSLGINTWAAEAAKSLKVPYIVYKYCKDISSRWPQESKEIYKGLLDEASSVVVVHDKEWDIEMFKKTKDQMLQDANIVYHSYPNGDFSVNKAEKLGKEIKKLLPSEEQDDYHVPF